MQQTPERLTDLIGKRYDLTLIDMASFDAMSVQLDYPDACRAIDAVRLIINDPLYKGDIPADYFD